MASQSSWGNITGPYHHELNPGGKGDNVTDLVVFSPWARRAFDKVIIGELVSGEGFLHREKLEFVELDAGDGTLVRSGDSFEAVTDTVVLLYGLAPDPTGDAEGISLFFAAGTQGGFFLEQGGEQDEFFVWMGPGFVALHAERGQDSNHGGTRGTNGTQLSVHFNRVQLIEEIFLRDDYVTVMNIGQITNTTFLSLKTGDIETTLTTYEGLVDVVTRTGYRETVGEYTTVNPIGYQTALSCVLVVLDGPVFQYIGVDGNDISKIEGAYRIPSFGGAERSLAIVPGGGEFTIDVYGQGPGRYLFSFSRVRAGEERRFMVLTTATKGTQDRYTISRTDDLSLESSDTKKLYDAGILQGSDGDLGMFLVKDFQMRGGGQSFSVTDWSSLGDNEVKPVNYAAGGEVYELSTGTAWEEIRMALDADESNAVSLLLSFMTWALLLVLFAGGDSLRSELTRLLEKMDRFRPGQGADKRSDAGAL